MGRNQDMSAAPAKKKDSVEIMPSHVPKATPSPDAVVVESIVTEKEEEGPYTLYTVRPGDTLSRIARKVYGRSAPWKSIYNVNRDQLKSPHNLKVGQVLKIPDGE